jgi:hypothetical protein
MSQYEITPRMMEKARRRIAAGDTLRQAAVATNIRHDVLDLLLWNDFARPKPEVNRWVSR